MRMRVVTFQLEIFVLEAEEIFYFRIQVHDGQITRLTRELQIYLLEVVRINMCIT